MNIRLTQAADWTLLKQIRLAALLDSPTAFAVSYRQAASETDAQWRERASAVNGAEFWLATQANKPIGMVGAKLGQMNRYNLIGMWVEPAARGSGVAAQLVDAVKIRASEKGHQHVFLEVSAENARATNFYLSQGFTLIDEWEALDSHPHIMLQSMVWVCTAQD